MQHSGTRVYFWQHSLQVKVGCILVTITTLIFIGFGIYQYLELKSQNIAELETLANVTSARLQENLAKPLWDFDPDLAAKVLLSEMQEKSIAAIVVHNEKGKLFVGKTRDDRWQIVDARDRIPDQVITRRQDLLNDNQPVGSFELYLTQKFMQADLRHTINRLILMVSILDIAIFVVLSVTLRFLFIRPIAHLLKIGQAIAVGDFGQEIPVRQQDEMGMFVEAFNHLIGYLREMAAAATAISQGTLSQKVVARSEQDEKSADSFPHAAHAQ